MRKFKTVFMRGGTSKGCLFKKEDLPADREDATDNQPGVVVQRTARRIMDGYVYVRN